MAENITRTLVTIDSTGSNSHIRGNFSELDAKKSYIETVNKGIQFTTTTKIPSYTYNGK